MEVGLRSAALVGNFENIPPLRSSLGFFQYLIVGVLEPYPHERGDEPRKVVFSYEPDQRTRVLVGTEPPGALRPTKGNSFSQVSCISRKRCPRRHRLCP